MNFDPMLANAPFWLTGLALGALAWFTMWARRLWSELITRARSRFVVSLTVTDDESLFHWLLYWFGEQPYAKSCRRLTGIMYADRSDPSEGHVISSSEPIPATSSRSVVKFVPAPGVHVFRSAGTFLTVNYVREAAQGTNRYRQTITISALSRSAKVLRRITDEADRMMNPVEDERIGIFVHHWQSWVQVTKMVARPADSVILPGATMQHLIETIDEFERRRRWYAEHNVPWRLGFLFYGTPGTGKTSTCIALAGHFKRSIYLLNLGDPSLTDQGLVDRLGNIPARAFVVLEDIDAAFKERTAENKEGALSFSGLLNALDGISSKEGRILFMTTNHKPVLDPALIRPGRADVHVEFESATPAQLAALYERFYPDATPDDVIRWAGTLGDNVTMAEAQQAILDDVLSPSRRSAAVAAE